MTIGAYNENAYEKAVMELLAKEGWQVEYGPDIERDYGEATWDEVLREQIFAINRDTSSDALCDALNKLKDISGGSVAARNAKFTDWLQNGIEADCIEDGEARTVLVDLIDYAHPERNTFHAVNQWTVQNGEVVKRPDVVLFVNGLPLVVIELKNPSKPETTVHEAFLQLRNYQHDIPELFTYNQICVASDMVSTKAGTITAGESWFKEWKSIDGEWEKGGVGNFETLFRGLLEPKRLLDVVKNFICFSGKGPKADKILAGYHQYFAVRKAIKKTKEAMRGDGRGGVFWHTQGSGKSLSMVFYAHLLASELDGPTVLVLTDRNDLDGQLYGQFLKCAGFLRQTAEQATSRAHLKEFLKKRKQNGLFFSTIQKFEESDDALSRRRDVIVIADEAHRGHYGFAESEKVVRKGDGTIETRRVVPTARIIHDSLPNATFIGFKGTPIELGDRSTREVFGNYIDIYDMTQAVEDGATRPVYYESRRFEAGFMEAVRGMLNQWTMSGSGGEKKGLAELNAQIAELVKESVASNGVINLFSDKKEAVSLFDAAFLTEIRRMKEKNLSVEILKKLLTDSVKLHARKNLVKSEEFSELLNKAMNEYINGHITNEEVIKRLIELAKRIKEGIDSTPKGLNEDEAAFYEALSKPEAVRKFYTDDTLIQLTKELTDQLRRNRTVDWDRRDSARAHMRMLVKRLLKKYKYPPEEATGALETVMRQCELWVDTTAE